MADSTRICSVLGMAIGMGLTACAVDPQEQLGTTEGMSFAEFKARVSVEPGTNDYVVDWDQMVRGDDALLEFYYRFQQGALAIYTQNGVDVTWNVTQKRNLTYCISNDFGARKQQVIDAMVFASDNGWEKFADVNFVYVPAQDATCNAANNAVLFDVSPITGAPYTARSFFPDSGRTDRNVMIDSTAFTPQGQIGLPQIIAHELGHTLGFRHEHIRPEAAATQCIEDNQFRGLTTYDSASVMHYPQCNGTSTTLAFTARDQQGVALIYGPAAGNVAPLAQVTAPTNGATVGPSFEVQAQVVDTDLARAELYIDGTLVQTLTAAPFTFQVTALALGAHSLEIKGTDSGGQVGTQTVAITVASGGGTGGGSGGGGSGASGATGDTEITGGCNSGGGGTTIVFGLGLVVAAKLRRRRR